MIYDQVNVVPAMRLPRVGVDQKGLVMAGDGLYLAVARVFVRILPLGFSTRTRLSTQCLARIGFPPNVKATESLPG